MEVTSLKMRGIHSFTQHSLKYFLINDIKKWKFISVSFAGIDPTVLFNVVSVSPRMQALLENFSPTLGRGAFSQRIEPENQNGK